MDITKLTETELKALKCDCYEIISMHQMNLQAIDAELKKRQTPVEPVETKEKK